RPSPHLHPFPTRRSSDLPGGTAYTAIYGRFTTLVMRAPNARLVAVGRTLGKRNATPKLCESSSQVALTLGRSGLRSSGPNLLSGDRKSTRLNSSHVKISY